MSARACAPLMAAALTLAVSADAATPVAVEQPAPEYPAWAIGSGVGTEVELRVLVERDGRVREVRVVPYDVRHDILTRRMRAGFDSAAVRAVRRWVYRPATRAGKAVSSWLTIRVPFQDPADAEGPVASGAPSPVIEPERVELASRFPKPIRQEPPEWPAAACYVCSGTVVVHAGVDAGGVVRAVRIARRLYRCPDSLLAAAIDSAAARAAWRHRFGPAETEGGKFPVVTTLSFRIPDPPARGAAVVGCVRDSLTGRPLPGADLYGPAPGRGLAPPRFGRSDETGWFVLTGGQAGPREVSAHVFCRGGGLRRARPWRRPGDELTLYVWQNTCTIDGR